MVDTPTVLTIAGSDSSGGAGIQADLKTVTALGGYGMSAITALTAQNTTGVRGIFEVSPQFVAAQIDAVMEDIAADAAKTGMLSNAGIIEAVADRVAYHHIAPLVVDPVMVAKSGDALLAEDAQSTLKEKLLPLALLVTPNLPEAAALAGMPVEEESHMQDAAQAILQLGPAWVLVKGGHLRGEPLDLLVGEGQVHQVRRPRIETHNTHGTGCTYSSAIATGLAMGMPVPECVAWARDALQGAIRNAFDLGRGAGPLDHGCMYEHRLY